MVSEHLIEACKHETIAQRKSENFEAIDSCTSQLLPVLPFCLPECKITFRDTLPFLASGMTNLKGQKIFQEECRKQQLDFEWAYLRFTLVLYGTVGPLVLESYVHFVSI